MKRFKEIEENRRAYHENPVLNSVHRSSLLVPEIEGCEAEVSFMNHFLIKRKYPNVACRVTAMDAQGKRIVSSLYPVTEPRVYRFKLSELFRGKGATSYHVEFYAAENLFIPFPAVMVNHYGKNFINSVHSYNRVLNDIFENDSIKAVHVKEASIDVHFDADYDTFCLFTAGMQDFKGEIELELTAKGKTHKKTVPVDVKRFNNVEISLKECFPEIKACKSAILKIDQPEQFMFYGRMLVGVRAADGAFSGNHSYYDCSAAPETWEDGSQSYRMYPILPGMDTKIRMYPIMSPGTLAMSATLFDRTGAVAAEWSLGELTSPSSQIIDLSLRSMAADHKLDWSKMSAFCLKGQPVGGNTPTRINHQLVYGDAEICGSINTSLFNSNVFQPKNKPGRTWGQVIVGGGFKSVLGITTGAPGGDPLNIKVDFYDEKGKLGQREWIIPTNAAHSFDVEAELKAELESTKFEEHQILWYEVSSSRSDVAAYVASYHEQSKHCTAEHSF